MTSTSSGSPSARPDPERVGAGGDPGPGTPPDGRRRLGAWGEQLAAQRYEALGYRVLDRNWRCPAGELDLVVSPPGPAPTVVFVEVKARRGAGFGTPLEAVTPAKQRRTRRAAAAWLAARRSGTGAEPSGPTSPGRPAGRDGARGRRPVAVRFDVVGVLGRPDGPTRIDVVEDAF